MAKMNRMIRVSTTVMKICLRGLYTARSTAWLVGLMAMKSSSRKVTDAWYQNPMTAMARYMA